jgi:hypothetical protein
MPHAAPRRRGRSFRKLRSLTEDSKPTDDAGQRFTKGGQGSQKQKRNHDIDAATKKSSSGYIDGHSNGNLRISSKRNSNGGRNSRTEHARFTVVLKFAPFTKHGRHVPATSRQRFRRVACAVLVVVAVGLLLLFLSTGEVRELAHQVVRFARHVLAHYVLGLVAHYLLQLSAHS